ncbi:MAG: hypothetical protein WAK45_04380 [Methanoregula sp.]|uniref:hypothetical protein n=1 Tax=Methanoregula sp. TaxID=2052170 RepID=UPI003BAF89C2
MRKDILCLFAVISVGVILVAGCTTTSSGTTAAPSAPGQETVATLVNGTDAFNASIYQVTASRPQPGYHEINIYLTTLNTGNSTFKLHWFSRITGPNGVSYGGVGVSHGGSGQETDILGPGSEGTGRDYVIIDSDADYAAMAKEGATLNVSFVTEPLANETPMSFQTSWTLDPSVFT